ncbi:hypothetical protein [Comamonas sp. E6]|uniref:hypothetical protein n=1 Tax=unclassified Comamonas TaxID=2638500 RepID=UPI00187CFF11|nr:hypothetical protein [Comamonas sp. E6]
MGEANSDQVLWQCPWQLLPSVREIKKQELAAQAPVDFQIASVRKLKQIRRKPLSKALT